MTAVSDAALLLRAVLLNPDDTTRSRIYADCLDDIGDPARAAFLRAMLDSRQADAPRDWISNRRLALDLLRQHSHWLTGSYLAVPVTGSFFDPQGSIQAGFGPLTTWWKDGLCWCLRGDLLPVLRYAPDVFARHPVREVLLADVDAYCLRESFATESILLRPSDDHLYCWAPALLSDRIMDALEDAGRMPEWLAIREASLGVTQTYYTSRHAANAALSSVVVAFFRRLAGLETAP